MWITAGGRGRWRIGCDGWVGASEPGGGEAEGRKGICGFYDCMIDCNRAAAAAAAAKGSATFAF